MGRNANAHAVLAAGEGIAHALGLFQDQGQRTGPQALCKPLGIFGNIPGPFRQLLLLRALGHRPPAYFHAPLLRDVNGQRLAKRHDALSLRALRESGRDPADLIAEFEANA